MMFGLPSHRPTQAENDSTRDKHFKRSCKLVRVDCSALSDRKALVMVSLPSLHFSPIERVEEALGIHRPGASSVKCWALADAHMKNAKVLPAILTTAAVTLSMANLTYASHQHSGAECYHNGHRIYVPDGFDYPRQAWPSWGISCRTPKPEMPAGSGGTAADSGDRPLEWCGWWMRQHLGGHYGPEFNVALNWLNVGRPLDGLDPVPLVSRLIMCSRWFGWLIRDMCWRSPVMTTMPF